jgi:hypothetical protein
MERSIGSDRQAQAADLPGVSNSVVNSVDCVKSSDQHARCLADVDYNDAETGAQQHEQIAVNVTIGRDGQYVWETAQ